jgi:hypothetical protein
LIFGWLTSCREVQSGACLTLGQMVVPDHGPLRRSSVIGVDRPRWIVQLEQLRLGWLRSNKIPDPWIVPRHA